MVFVLHGLSPSQVLLSCINACLLTCRRWKSEHLLCTLVQKSRCRMSYMMAVSPFIILSQTDKRNCLKSSPLSSTETLRSPMCVIWMMIFSKINNKLGQLL